MGGQLVIFKSRPIKKKFVVLPSSSLLLISVSFLYVPACPCSCWEGFRPPPFLPFFSPPFFLLSASISNPPLSPPGFGSISPKFRRFLSQTAQI